MSLIKLLSMWRTFIDNVCQFFFVMFYYYTKIIIIICGCDKKTPRRRVVILFFILCTLKHDKYDTQTREGYVMFFNCRQKVTHTVDFIFEFNFQKTTKKKLSVNFFFIYFVYK